MKQKIYPIIFLLVFSFTAQLSAQFGGFSGKKGPSIKGKITGEIIDSTSAIPVGFATISLKRPGKEKIVDGVLSDDNGKFKLADIKNGKYDVEISFLGYRAKILRDVEVTLKDPDNDLGKIMLAPDNVILDEVQITEKRSLIENKVDKIVFNAEDDSSIAGGDATEVLRKVPLLSVDLDGNVSLRGSQNIRILINGKPSGMFATNPSEALKMFPADQIKKVEVITSPGAKYDGEGSGGIINIITKKENVEGIAGSINASAGNRSSNANVNLNIGKGRFGFTTNAGMWYSLPQDGTSSFVRTADSGEIINSITGITNTSRLGFNGSASAFYDFNAYNAINTSISLRGFGFDTDGTSDILFGLSQLNRATIGDNINSGYDWNTDYTKKFANNDKQELSFAVQVSGNVQNQDNNVIESLLGGAGFNRNENIINDGDNLELTGQIDYVHPVGKANKLELGVKSVIRNIDSDSRFEVLSEDATRYEVDNQRSNLFLYDQDVYAGYLSYNFFLGKINVVTGARYERTDIKGDGEACVGVDCTNGYNNVLPNIAISKTLKNFRTLKLSYSRRIERPSLRFINPFINTTDFTNISFGNPQLNPELTDQLELGYNTNILGFTIFGSLYYKKSKDIIESVVGINDSGVGITTFQNVGENNSVGVNLFTSKNIGKITIRGGGDVYSYNASGLINGVETENSALSYRLFTNGEYSFSGNIKADFFGFFQAPRFTLQGENASFSIFGVGFRYDFKKTSLGIRIIEPFAANKNFDSDIQGNGFRQVSSFSLPFRSIGINVRYKFGKVDFRERKSKIRNTDLKQGQDGQGGGQQGGQSGNRG